jgi:hypothetical protein
MGEELRPAESRNGHGVAVQGDKFGAKNIPAGLDVAWDLDIIRVSLLDQLFVLPLFSRPSVVVE